MIWKFSAKSTNLFDHHQGKGGDLLVLVREYWLKYRDSGFATQTHGSGDGCVSVETLYRSGNLALEPRCRNAHTDIVSYPPKGTKSR